MALFKVLRGDESNLPATLNDGWAYFCSDTGNFYIDWADDAGNLTRTQVNANYAGKLKYEEGGSLLEIDPREIALKNDLVQIDPSLSVEGAAADAKAVGEALQDVSANYVKSSEKAAANGVATLDASGKLQESQKPSYSASEVGLGNVPNVATNDQTPTYTEASTLATLTSGEKLSVAFGKIKKAITDLISHIANTSNPHAVTAEQAGAAPTSHASTATTYGKATSSNYGHVKLSASTSSTSGASSGVAATPSAVKSAYDLANGKQDKISVSGVTGQTKAITCGSTVTLASLAIEAGTYLVFGNAKFPSASSTSGKYVIQCCLSKSTTYNHNASMAIPNNSAAASTLNPHGVFTLSSAGTIYLLGYHGGDSTMTVENINLYAVKIG